MAARKQQAVIGAGLAGTVCRDRKGKPPSTRLHEEYAVQDSLGSHEIEQIHDHD